MAFFHRLRVWLLVVGLVHFALPARAVEQAKPSACPEVIIRVEVTHVLAAPSAPKAAAAVEQVKP